MTRRWPDWRGCTAVIVASGPSAASVPLVAARSRAKFIAINDSWRLAPWTDIVYACDGAWWRKNNGLQDYRGVRLTEDRRASEEFGLGRVNICRGCDRYVEGPVGTVGDGGNSGFQALNLALQLGVASVALVGFDMSLSNGVHWHGKHEGLNNPRPHNIDRWVSAKWPVLDNVSIINCAADSALTVYPKVDFKEWLMSRP